MAIETPYPYTLGQFPNGIWNSDRLKAEVLAKTGILVALADLQTGEAGEAIIIFRDPLPAEQIVFLDEVVAAHSGASFAAPTQLVALEGVPQVHASPRPAGLSTYFSCAGDVAGPGGVGGGNKLIFNMIPTDIELVEDAVYNEDVWIKDGLLIYKDAPFGASVDAEVYHPTDDVCLGSFVRKGPILGSGWSPFDTEDKGYLPAGFRLRIRVRNSSGADGEDAAAAFKVTARVEMFRSTTV
jgi:hypothetical protein